MQSKVAIYFKRFLIGTVLFICDSNCSLSDQKVGDTTINDYVSSDSEFIKLIVNPLQFGYIWFAIPVVIL